MTYTLLPNSGQSLGQTRSSIRTNFSLIQTAQNTNHVAIDGSGAGKHKFLQMPEQGSAPATAANEAGFYAKVGTNPAQSNLFFRGESSGFEYQLTKAISASTALFGTNAAYGVAPAGTVIIGGWTFLPGGLILQYGLVTGTGALNTPSTRTVPFPIAFNAVPYTVHLQVRRDNASDSESSISRTTLPTSTDFTYVLKDSTANGFYWTAIGV